MRQKLNARWCKTADIIDFRYGHEAFYAHGETMVYRGKSCLSHRPLSIFGCGNYKKSAPSAKTEGAISLLGERSLGIDAALTGPPHGVIQLLEIGAGIGVIFYAVIEGTGLAMRKPLVIICNDLGQIPVQLIHRQHIRPWLAVPIPKSTFYLVQVADDRQGHGHVLVEVLRVKRLGRLGMEKCSVNR